MDSHRLVLFGEQAMYSLRRWSCESVEIKGRVMGWRLTVTTNLVVVPPATNMPCDPRLEILIGDHWYDYFATEDIPT